MIAGIITNQVEVIKIKKGRDIVVIQIFKVQEAAAVNGSIPKEKLN